MSSFYEEVDSCRICGSSDLTHILSLGDQHVSDFVDSPREDTIKAPLDLVLCNAEDGGCGLLQLKHTVDPDYLFKDYWYKSGINESMIEALKNVVVSAEEVCDLSEEDTVVDIGANDGTMLRMFDGELDLVGFEPAENIVDQISETTATIVNDYFSADAYYDIRNEPAELVTSIAMFYDLDNPNEFVSDVADVLANDGVWIIQMAYLPRKLEMNAFDSIVHEHLEYYSLLPLENLLQRHNLEVFDMSTNEVNGGSFRVYIKKEDDDLPRVTKVYERLEEYRNREQDIGLYNKQVYEDFANRVEMLKEKTVAFIEEANERNESVYLYGASTKGNTLLQYYGLDNSLIDGAAERDPDKYGKMTVGTHIPIVPEKEARPKADYFLVLPWHFMDVFLERESEFLRNGGKFIKPLPHFEVIGEEKIPEDAEQ